MTDREDRSENRDHPGGVQFFGGEIADEREYETQDRLQPGILQPLLEFLDDERQHPADTDADDHALPEEQHRLSNEAV